MGTSGIEKERIRLTKRNNRHHFFSAYSSIKNIINGSINMIGKEVYLINSNSIRNFLELLEKDKVFDNLNKKEELNKIEEKLKTKFEDYSILDNNIKIYSNYQECKEASRNESNIIFIIVDENFIKNFKVKSEEYRYKEVKIVEKKDEHLKIIFPISQKTINAVEIENKKGFFKFCTEEENKNIIKTIEKKENKEEIRFNSMIKNICYCLIKIKTLNYFFLCCGDMIKENKSISKIFFDIIKQRNINGKIDCFELFKICKSQKLSEIKSITDYLYDNMHDELKENNLSNNNNFNINNRSLNQTGEDSIIKKIFCFYNTIFYNCSVCNNISSNISFMNIILFPLKKISKYKNSKKLLNISDCFDYFISGNNIECPKCSNKSNSYYNFRINSINEILTIIIDRENDLINDIYFQLDFKIELSKYCLNKNEICELELIGFSCYDNNKDIDYSYFKINPENKWYYFNDTKEKIINSEELNYEFPVLLFYKKIDNNI